MCFQRVAGGLPSNESRAEPMTDKELRKLRRDDLLQILIDQQRQIDELNAKLGEAKAALEERRIKLEQSGSVAEAALKLNEVFEAAQAAADQYRQQMTEDADAMRAQAQVDADEIRHAARGDAERILREARAEAGKLLREAGARPEPAPQPAPVPEEPEKHRKGLLWGKKKA